MKFNLIVILSLFFAVTHFSQEFDKEMELRKIISMGGKVDKLSGNKYNITYSTGESRHFVFGDKQSPDNFRDTTIIRMWEIDTLKYYSMFRFDQKLDIYNLSVFVPPLIDDLNNNGLPEIYGRDSSGFMAGGPVVIYEQDNNGIFSQIFAYADTGTIGVQAIGEVHGDGIKEIYLYHKDSLSGVFYKSDSPNTLPGTYDFKLYYDPGNSIIHFEFGEWNRNNITDAALIARDTSLGTVFRIAEFNDQVNNFETTFQIASVEEIEFSKPVISDFDGDDKTEFVFGSCQGNIFIVENSGENNYELTSKIEFPTNNTYMNAATNDIDGNGKPEFWIGGQDFEAGITRFQCFESSADNTYETVAVIELRYINSLTAAYLQTKDMDGDGKEELIISLANTILILTFTGYENKHRYNIYYAKRGEASQLTALFDPLSLADLNGDDKIDILLPMVKYVNPDNYSFSYILTQNSLLSGENDEELKVEDLTYIKSFPVPFNSTATIDFYLDEQSPVKIKIYNSLGQEVNTLLDEDIASGQHKIHWSAVDNNNNTLPSGIYFITMQTNKVLKTTKTILMK